MDKEPELKSEAVQTGLFREEKAVVGSPLPDKFRELVANMRRFQKIWDENNAPSILAKCRAAEAAVDAALR